MKEKFSIYGALGITGGVSQILAESDRIVSQSASGLAKFPNGFESMNVVEEFIEGSLPMVAGALAGQYGYEVIRRVTRRQYNPGTELKYMVLGGALASCAMIVSGEILHRYLDVPDIKWGPFR